MPDKREPLKDGITRITSERTGKVSWEARWSYHDLNGVRRYGRERFDTLKAAKSARARNISAIDRGSYAPATRMTVGEFAERWLARRSLTWASSTTFQRRMQWEQYVRPVIGGMRLPAVQKVHCQAVVSAMHSKAFQPMTIRGAAALMSALFNGALDDGLIVTNPAKRLDLPPMPQYRHETWTKATVQEFLRFTVNRPMHALYYVFVTTGIRIGEALALQWGDIDFDRNIIVVDSTLRKQENGRFVPSRGTKTKRARAVRMTTGCAVALEAHRARQDEYRATAKRWDDLGFVFAGWRGHHLSPRVFNRHLQEDMEASGIEPRLTAHGFRHTVATIMMVDGVQSNAIKDHLGHTSVATTLNMYAHVTDEFRDSVADRLSDLLDIDTDTTTTTPEIPPKSR